MFLFVISQIFVDFLIFLMIFHIFTSLLRCLNRNAAHSPTCLNLSVSVPLKKKRTSEQLKKIQTFNFPSHWFLSWGVAREWFYICHKNW